MVSFILILSYLIRQHGSGNAGALTHSVRALDISLKIALD